jgi:hypothetical protein
MASKSQQYNASVNFGASVDPSMTRTLNRLSSGIDHIGTETSAVMKTQTAWQRQMKAGSSSTVEQMKHMERATQALINKHESLEKEIREGVKSGRAGTAFLIEDYRKVGIGIENARREMERLTKEQEREKHLAQQQQRLEAGRAKWRERGENLTASGRSGLAAMATTVAKAPLAIGAAGAGLLSGVVALNHKTAEEYRLAKQYGMSFKHYKAGSILAEQAGLNGENYGDLTEELSNKLGEAGNEKTINPLLWQLGIASKDALKGTKQQQFDKVMERISSSVNSGKLSAQQGESLADQLMGGEANKLMTYIISTGKSYEEVMKNADRLNNISEDEARGAMESSQILSNLWTSAETAMQGITGELGSALGPQLKAWEQQGVEWVKENKGQIAKSINEWVTDGGPKRAIDAVKMFGDVTMAVAQKLSWLLPEDRKPEDMDSEQAARVRALEIAGAEADKKGLKDGFWGGATGTGEWSQYVKKRQDEAATAWVGKHEGVSGDTVQPESQSGETIPVFSRPGGSSVNNTHNNQYHFNVVINGGATEAGAQELYDKFTALTGGINSPSDTFDIPDPLSP